MATETKYFVAIFGLTFSSITVGLFLWLLDHASIFAAAGGALMLAGVLFSVLALGWVCAELDED